MESELLPQAAPPPESSTSDSTPEDTRSKQNSSTGVIIAVVVVLLLLVAGLVTLFIVPAETTARVRDVFIIVLALETLLIGFALVLLIVQLARLTNLLQNEIKPILDSTNETVSTLRGTTEFLSNNLVEPVIKLNEVVAMLKQVGAIFSLGRRKN